MHGRFGNKFPRPEHSLTAAIAARCAAKTWYNERNPRRAGMTMTICTGRESCRHKKIWTAREQSPRRASATGLTETANAGVYKERKTYSRNRQGSDCLRLAGVTMTICAGRKPCRYKKTWTNRQESSSPGRHNWVGRNRGCCCASERANSSGNGNDSRFPRQDTFGWEKLYGLRLIKRIP